MTKFISDWLLQECKLFQDILFQLSRSYLGYHILQKIYSQKSLSFLLTYGTKYSRMGQLKFAENSL